MKNFQFSIARKLWLTVMCVFVALTVCFMVYQYKREKNYRIEVINAELQAYNHALADQYPQRIHIEDDTDMRITIVSLDGVVIYDSQDTAKQVNHLDRTEISQALISGSGYDIRRLSATMGEEFFYSATLIPDKQIIVRTALPYDQSLLSMLSANTDFIWLSIAIMSLLALIYEKYTRVIGQRIEEGKRRLKDKLEQSELDKLRMKRQLTQNMAHELKTPISSIYGFLDILDHNKESLTPEQTAEFIHRSYLQSLRLSHLMTDIVTLNNMDENRKVERETFSLRELVEDVNRDVVFALEASEMTFANLLPELKIYANYAMIYSAFRNLADNAIAYAGHGASIIVSLKTDADGEPYISFADNGVGVADEHLPLLFERFYRVDKGRSRSMGGTGLGLAIVKNAVIYHGGKITAVNRDSGGLEFQIRFDDLEVEK